MMAIITLLLAISPFLFFRPKDFFQPEFFLNLYFIMLIGLGPLALSILRPDIYRQGNYSTVLSIIAIGFICINFGFALQDILHNKFKIVITGRLYRSVLTYKAWVRSRKNQVRFVGLGLACLSCLASAIYFLRAGQIPLFAADKESARVAALSIPGNGYFLYIMTLGIFAPAFYYLPSVSASGKKAFKNPLLIAITVMLCCMLLFTGSRRYSIWLGIYLISIYHYLEVKVSIKKMMLFAVVGVVFVNVFEMVRNPNSDTTVDFMTTAGYRLIVYISNLEKVFTAFISHDPLYGATFFMDVATIMPGKQVDYQSWLKEIVGLEFEGFGIPPTVMGDMYINFGYPGVVVGCTLLGYLVKLIYRMKILQGKTGFGIIIYMSSLEIFSKIITSGISAQSMSILWMAMVYLSIYLFFRLLPPKSI